MFHYFQEMYESGINCGYDDDIYISTAMLSNTQLQTLKCLRCLFNFYNFTHMHIHFCHYSF